MSYNIIPGVTDFIRAYIHIFAFIVFTVKKPAWCLAGETVIFLGQYRNSV